MKPYKVRKPLDEIYLLFELGMPRKARIDAAGAAIQNMNIMIRVDEGTGL